MLSEKLVITTKGLSVLANQELDASFSCLQPCNHEEADTRIILHLAQGASIHKKAMFRTVDTDVVVLSVAAVIDHGLEELWVAFGSGVNFRYIPAHQLANTLGPVRSRCLPLFHSLTGCDTVSSFHNIGKKKAWHVWEIFPDVTDCFLRLAAAPRSITDVNMALIERFVVLMYDRTSNDFDVNSARQQLFTKTGRQMENIPPTSAALLQHVKRAVYQGGHVWGQASLPSPPLPNPSDWGWTATNDGQWKPYWSHLPSASEVCRELIKCACRKGCGKKCSCAKEGLECTALCLCDGDCAGNGRDTPPPPGI